MKSNFCSAMALSSFLLSASAFSSETLPSDKVVIDSAYACIGMAKTYGGDAHRFDFEKTKEYISAEVDDCVKTLSWTRFDADKGKDVEQHIRDNWNRTDFDVSDEQYAFYAKFHELMQKGAHKAAHNDLFRGQMTQKGKDKSQQFPFTN